MSTTPTQPPRRPIYRSRWIAPFAWIEWSFEWVVYWFSALAIFQVLEYVGRLTVLVAVIFYFLEAPERTKQSHYQAWQVINSAHGQRTSGGRIDALQDLNKDGISLEGLVADQAFLRSINLSNALLTFASLQGADLSDAQLQRAYLASANLQEAKLWGAQLQGAFFLNASLRGAVLEVAQLQGAGLINTNLQEAILAGANLQGADLSDANLQGADFFNASLQGANLTGADLIGADFRVAHGITVDQIKTAKNWEQAIYNDNFRAQLGLPPNPTTLPASPTAPSTSTP